MVETTPVARPRPFSLACGIAFFMIGIGGFVDAWADVDSGAVAALALLLGGAGALVALATRRAPLPPVEPN